MSEQLAGLLLASDRDTVVEFVLAAIHGFTILGREPELSLDQRAMVNNWIHYLAGHARELLRGEELSESQASAMASHFSNLPPSLNKHALRILQ